jgi:outer membrane protein TolC
LTKRAITHLIGGEIIIICGIAESLQSVALQRKAYNCLSLPAPFLSAMEIAMCSLTGWGIIVSCLCSLTFLAGAASAADLDKPAPSARGQLLSPLTLDDRYLPDEIPARNPSGTLTLRGAVAESAVHNKEVLEASLEVSRFKWDYLASETNRLPHVKVLSYLAEQTVNTTLIPARTNAFLFMSALFPVTQQYRFGLEAKAVKLAREIAAQRLRQRLDETTAKVKEAYYKLALDESLLDDIQDSLKYLSELQKTVADQVKRGNSLKVEEMEVAARLAKAQLDETKARNSYNIDRETFNHLLGRDLKSAVTLEVIPPIDQLEVNVERSESKALAMRPEIREADARVRQVRLEKKIIMSDYIPNVSAGVVYITLPGFNNSVISKNILAPGIFIDWDGFDWGRKAMLAKARSQVEQAAALTAQSTREQVLIDLHSQINKLSESRQLVQTTRLARAASRERMRVSMNRYKYTADKLADVLQAQSSLSDENNNYHQALVAFWAARAEFERALGADR